MATGPTWAQVVHKKKPTTFHPTECAVNLEQFATPLHLPPVSSRHSAFVPLPSFPFVLSTDQVEQLSGLSESEWMTMAQTAQESFNNEEVNAFMDSPPEHIIASFKNAIDHFRAHPIPSTDVD